MSVRDNSEPAYVAEPDPPIDLSKLPISGDWTPYVELLGIGGFVRHPFTPMPVCEISPLRTDNPDATRPHVQALPPMELPSTKTPEMQQTATRLQMPTTRADQGSDAQMTKYYRARIVLEEITPLPTDDTATYENTRTSEIAEITVTGGTPGSAMNQIVAHAQGLAKFHAVTADPWAHVKRKIAGEDLPPTALELLDGKKEPKR